MSKTVDKVTRENAQPAHGWEAATDEELIAIYKRSSERRAFDELVHRYERELYSYLRRYLGDATLAEDAFQTTFLQVHLKCDQFEEGRKFRPWLYTIATNQAIDTQRRNKRHKLVSLDRRQGRDSGDDLGALLDLLTTKESGPVGEVETTERANWIRRAVSELPDTLRAAVTLIYYQGMRYREAADVLGIPVGTVKSRLHTAVLKLNEAWRETNGAAEEGP